MSVGAPTIARAADLGARPEVDDVVDPPGQRVRIPFLPGLEGLRGVALLGVVLFHSGFTWARGGFLGVSTFFTLSGFLITLLLVWEFSSDGRIDLRRFWGRRFRRLMPAALTCLAGIVVYGALAASPLQIGSLRGDVLAALAYVANWRFIVTGQSYSQLFSAPSPVLHFWSLAIEEQFYLVFPLVVAGAFALGRGSRRLLGAILIVLAVTSLGLMFVLYQPGHDPSRVYYGTGTRSFELLLGALLAVLLTHPAGFVLRVPRWAWGVAGTIGAVVTLVLWATVRQSSSWLYQGGLAGYSVMSALVIVAAIRRGPIRTALSIAPLRWLGGISYGAYLFHWPIFLWLSPARTHLSPWPLLVLRLALTFAAATFSARFIENPIRLRRRPRRVRPSLLSALGVATVIVALVAVSSARSNDTISFAVQNPTTLPPDLTVPAPTAPAPTVTADPAAVVTPTTRAPIPPPIPLKPGELPRMLVLGDSAALTLANGLQAWETKTHQAAVYNAGKLGCPVSRFGLVSYVGKPIPTYDWCDWTNDYPTEISADRPHIIMVLFGTWDVADRLMRGDTVWRSIGDPVYDAYLRSEIAAAMDTMTASGSTVVWLSHPYIRSGISEGLPGPFPEEDPARMDRFNAMVREVAASRPRVVLLDLQAYMRARPQGELDLSERPDGIHWTQKSAAKMEPWLGDALNAIARGETPPLATRSG